MLTSLISGCKQEASKTDTTLALWHKPQIYRFLISCVIISANLVGSGI